MANRFLGEATTTVDGVVYTLRFDFNAMVEFEEQTGVSAMDTFENAETGKKAKTIKAGHLRAMVWAMLQRHHPGASPQLAGDILSVDAGIIQRVMSAAAAVVEADGGNGAGRGTARPV